MRKPLERSTLLAWAALACGLLGCTSAEEYRRDADRDAYELVRSRRAALATGDLEFTIEPDPDRLGERLRRGESADLERLDLTQCLQIAAENSRDYQSQKENLYIAALDLTLERWDFAVQKGGTLAAAVDGVDDEAVSADGRADFSLTELLGSGALIVGNIGLSVGRSLLNADGWHAVSDVGLGISQPLLAGAGESIVLEPLTQAERNLVYAVREYERFRRTFAFDVATRFYRLQQTADQVRNQETNLANLQLLSARNRALAEAGRLSAIELGQARQNELRSENSLLDSQARHQLQLDQFKLFLGLPIGCALELSGSGLSDLAETAPVLAIDDATATRTALANRLDYLTTLEQEEDAVRKVAVAEDALQGVLDVNADIRAQSEDGKPLEFDSTTWGIGAVWSLPFERLPQRNNWREAIIRREAAARVSQEAQDEIIAEVRNDLRQAATQREGWEIQQNAVELAEKRIESTTLLLDAGRADTRDLLEAQESLLSAQNSATAALIDYTLARMALYLDMELLRLDENGIALLEPPGEIGP